MRDDQLATFAPSSFHVNGMTFRPSTVNDSIVEPPGKYTFISVPNVPIGLPPTSGGLMPNKMLLGRPGARFWTITETCSTDRPAASTSRATWTVLFEK